ncbi:sensor histidine kinase [Streptomyces sp. 71268]|uniref:sensor histidine kinase n=1 Tax=Streptomyces sp. 71268 TaxID=3002640 RepID=UPI0023F62A77|nr:sensor histidine kinase [Streptomyces sp. 71268]WEV28657.1 sensor histidine kinase [Streptomyces sp. 71268]
MSTPRRGSGAPAAPPGREGLPWTRNDALVAVAAGVLDLVGFTIVIQSEQGYVPVAGCLLMVASAVPLLVRRRAPLLTLAAMLLFGLALNLSVSVPQHFNATTAVALFTVARSQRPAVTAVAAPVTVALTLVTRQNWPLPTLVDTLANAASGVLVVISAAVVNHWHREQAVKRQMLTDRAVADERRRIARELHDIVAHHITTMQLMAGGARANLGRNPEVAREALVTLEGSGRMALREMRQLLDVLRAGDEVEEEPTSPQPGVGDLGRIVDDSCRAGLPAVLDTRGDERPLPPSVGLTVFRIVQEALTNARKYAGQARATVRLTYDRDAVAVEVTDDGEGADTGDVSGSGYGLVGMRERVVLHGGTLETGPRDEGGFRVWARLPLTADEGVGR